MKRLNVIKKLKNKDSGIQSLKLELIALTFMKDDIADLICAKIVYPLLLHLHFSHFETSSLFLQLQRVSILRKVCCSRMKEKRLRA